MKERKIFIFALLIIFASISFYSFAAVTFKPGFYLRLRNEYWKNTFDMQNENKDNRNFYRIKYSLFGKLGLGNLQWGDNKIGDNAYLFLKLTDEFRPYVYQFHSNTGKKSTRFDIAETVFDNLYFDVKNFLGLPIDLRLGRQDFLFTYGEGFLIMDGTPQDGSRTYYFNAAKATWHINDKNSLDLVFIKNNRTDDFLPIINEMDAIHNTDGHTTLNTTNETGYILYLKSDSIKDTHLEAYYINKYEDGDNGSGIQAQNSTINTLGTFVKYKFSPYTLRGQLAYQFGDYGNNDRRAEGGYIFLDRSFKAQWSPKASIGYIYLSGDDKNTDTMEAWDPLFSRWPWMSELYVLSYASETGTGPGYWTNLQMYRAELALKPTKKSKLRFWANYLRANELATGSAFGNGKNRGQLYQARWDYKINKHMATYLLIEYFIPGDFYDSNHRDPALFTRAELSLKF